VPELAAPWPAAAQGVAEELAPVAAGSSPAAPLQPFGGFTGHFPANFLLAELQRFRDDVAELYRKLDGTVAFEPIEGQLKLRFEVDHLGHVAVSGSAMDTAGTGNRLSFRLMIDQTYLPALIKQLEACT